MNIKRIVIVAIFTTVIIILLIIYLQFQNKPVVQNSSNQVPTSSSVEAQEKQEQSDLDAKESDQEKLYVDLLLLNDRSFENIKQIYGSDYVIKSDIPYDLYQYKNGMVLKIFPQTGELTFIDVNDKEIQCDARILHGNVLPEEGKETVVLNGEELIIISETTNKVLKSVDTGYPSVNEFYVIPLFNDGSDEIYITDYENAQGIFKFVKGNLKEIFGPGYEFDTYSDQIKASITDNIFNFSFKIKGYDVDEKSILPARVFYNNATQLDKNSLLSISKTWEPVMKGGKWLVRERYTVNFAMLTYYWGPPDINAEDNETMYNDLARVDIYYEMKDGKPQFFNLDYKVKYSGKHQEEYPSIMDEEGRIINGPALGMSLEEAVKSLGGDKTIKFDEEYEYEKDGVYVCNMWGGTTDIAVKNPNYQTTRGLKVGDSIDNVERLYGSPDLGMSGDDYVEYKFCYLDEEGNLKIDYYRILMIYYKDDRVSSYEFYQVILD